MPLSIFITGGTSGIGLALARHYLSRGHNVGVCGRDESKFSELKEFSKAKCYKADVAKRDEIYHAIKNFHQIAGLDMVIASAGISFGRKTQIPDFARSRQVIEVNLLGTLNTFEPAIEIMTEQKYGHLVAISSVASLCGFPGVSSYSAAKAGVNKLCEGYAVDLKPYGIKVTTIAPGFVDTPLTQKNHHPMPFLVDVDVACKKIANAIAKEKSFYAFPFVFSSFLKFLSLMPRSLYLFIMGFFSFKYAKPKAIE